MAGTIVETDSNTRVIRKYVIAWTCTAGGVVSEATNVILSGVIERVNFVPDAIDVPTDQYTLTLADADGIDVLIGVGAQGLSSTTASTTIPLIAGNKIAIDDVLTLAVAGAGNAKKGTVSIYLSRKV